MFSEGGIKAVTARAAALPAPIVSTLRASGLLVPLLLAEAVAFAVASASGKIPAFLFTAVRALLTF